VIIELGERRDGFDEAGLRRDSAELVARYQRAILEDVQVGRLLLEVNRTAAGHGIKAPPELTLLGLAMILFIMAAGGGAMLAAQIVAHDRSRRRRT